MIVVQYFLLFGNDDNHGEKYTDACPKVGVLVGALALGPCGEACRITGPGFPICFPACVAGAGVAAGVVCDKKLKPILNSFNHEGDWNLYEVFLNEATLTPVVQIWYHHGLNHTKALRGYLPENSIRNHRGRRPLKINCGDVQEFCDPINSILEDLQNKYLNGTFDTFEVVDGNLQGHADAYVGLQGHELWPRNGDDNWSNLWHFFGIETTYNGAPLQTGTTGGGLAIPNIGEIPYPFPVTEPNDGPSDFLCRYNGVWGEAVSPQNRS